MAKKIKNKIYNILKFFFLLNKPNFIINLLERVLFLI